MDAGALSRLLAPDGWALLSALPPYDEARALALSTRLHAEGIDPELVAAALTQSRLRAKGRAKFGDFADGMLFTATGLEQATRLEVAAHHHSTTLWLRPRPRSAGTDVLTEQHEHQKTAVDQPI